MSPLSLDDQMALLMRGVTFGDDQIHAVMARELRERLAESAASGQPLRVYLGVDPTSSDLHLGHTVPLRKLRQFQELGHQVIFLIGSFTALIGDPSDKDKARPQQSREQVAHHARTYVEQVYKILDPQQTIVGTTTSGSPRSLSSNSSAWLAISPCNSFSPAITLPSGSPKAIPSGCTSSFTR